MSSNQSSDKTKRAVIYCRVSTKEQVEEGNSLATQEKICKEYALKNGYDIAEVFIEQGESAKTAKRTELQKMFLYCANRKNEVQAVIIYKIDRISRNTDDYSQIRLLLKQHRVEIKSTSELFEDTPVGRFLENTMANIAQFDNDIRTERSVNGMKEAMREGRYVWSAPIGYRNVRIAGKSTIAQDDHYAPIVKKMFEEVAKSIGTLEATRKLLKEEGLNVSKAYFYRMLKNEIYSGWIKKFEEKHKGIFEPIISQELFDLVSFVISGRSRSNTQYLTKNENFPLRRFIHYEGRRITGSWSMGCRKKYPYYRFLGLKVYFRKAELENMFKSFLDQFALESSTYDQFVKSLRENLVVKTENKEKQVERAKKHCEELRLKKKLIIEKNLSGIISDGTLKEQLMLIDREIFDNELLIYDFPKRKYPIEHLIRLAENLFKEPSVIWENAKFDLKLALQEFVFPLGVGFDGKNLRTIKICNLFKVKETISNGKYTGVPLRFDIANGGKNQNELTNIGDDKFLEDIQAELEEFADIMEGKKKEDPNRLYQFLDAA